MLFYKEIEKGFKINEKSIEYENIITNIIQLFPLTEKIVKKIIYHMKVNEKRYIIQGYDINRILIDGLKYFLSNFDIIENEKIGIIKEYNLQIKKYRSKSECEIKIQNLKHKIIVKFFLPSSHNVSINEFKSKKISLMEYLEELQDVQKSYKSYEYKVKIEDGIKELEKALKNEDFDYI